MNRIGTINFLKKIEQQFSVNDWIISDVKVWPFIRKNLAFYLYNQKSSTQLTSGYNEGLHEVKSIFHKLDLAKKHCSGLYRIAKYRLSSSGRKHAPVLFVSYSAHRTKIGDEWFNRFCDPLINTLGKLEIPSLLFEFPGSLAYHLSQANSQSVVLSEGLNTMAKLASLSSKKKAYSLPGYESFLELLANTCDPIIAKKLSLDRVKDDFLSLVSLSMKFEKIILTHNPKLVFVVCYYSKEAMAMCLAANRLSVPVIDIQHGVQDKYHALYGSWSRVPSEGYRLLPKLFWCWDKGSLQTIKDWTIQNSFHNVLLGGNPWMQLWEDQEWLQKIGHLFNKSPIADKTKKTILFTMQPEAVPLPENVLECIRKTSKLYNWLLRFHPRQTRKEEVYNILESNGLKDNVEYDVSTMAPLPYILTFVNLHLTYSSSVVIEAAECGIPSLVLHENGEAMYSKLVNKDLVNYYDNRDELSGQVQNILSKSPVLIKKEPKEKYKSVLIRLLKGSDETLVQN